ncbi:MAG: hypothetical protein BWK76_13955 [Desulfobulbaceae bacterium A2]|nr:MAG: hypothetical protein BWK76_13955 [Desulfobulbaceae bacterium A2]
MSDTVELHLPARLEFVGHAAALCRHYCRLCSDSLDEAARYAVELSVSEACTNAIKYGAIESGRPAEVIVRYTLRDEALEIAVLSRGPAFSLEDVPAPDFDKHPPGGYGLYLIISQMDQVRLTHDDGWNTLWMEKRRH